MSKRIALFIPSLRGGGAERVMINLAQGLSNIGFSVDIVLVEATGPYLSHVPSDVRVIDLKSRRTISSLPRLAKYLKRYHPQALLSAMGHANLVALWAKKISGVETRVVISMHTNGSNAGKYRQKLRARPIPYLMRKSFPIADRVVAVSDGVARDLIHSLGLNQDQIKVIGNPVVTPDMEERALESVDHPWISDRSHPIILSIGRLAGQKDFSTLVKAFALVRKEVPARLIILGEGEKRVEIEREVQALGIQESVSMPGFVSNPYAFISRSSVFVLSSRVEGLPTVLIESLALGTPIIATDCESGPSEILDGGRLGHLIPVGNVHAMKDALVEVLGNTDFYSSRSQQFKFEAQRYSLAAVTRNYLKVLCPE